MSALKSRKARALLAGGVVLGIGASMTLAAWSDSEWASGTFGTGGFTFQGSTTGAAASFDDHPNGSPASLDFSLTPENLTPGDSVEATYWVKATGADAKVTINKPIVGENAPANLTNNLKVEYFANDNCSDSAAATTGTLTGTGAVGNYDRGTATNGTALPTCIKITLAENYISSISETTGAVSWEFAASTASTTD